MRFLGRMFLVLVAAAALAAYLLYAPYGPVSETFVDIAPGTGTAAIASQLKHAGILRSQLLFEAVRVVKGGVLRAGEYRFDRPETTAEVYARLSRGDVYTRTLTIPEGFNIFDIAHAVEAAGLGSADAFLAAERADTSLIAQWSPQASSLEGYLFPDTYHFSRHSTPQQMVAAMVRRFRQATTQLGLAQAGDPTDGTDGTNRTNRPDGTNRTIIMASLIEKEVRQDAERPLVAGVFVNRLARGMPLETDPAVIYAALLEGRYRGTIYASDLQSQSPYNTYRHPGLPPGPIANPGAAAIRAALAPAQTDYLYFVSDASGHTRFSATLQEHGEQVREYRAASGTAPTPPPPPPPAVHAARHPPAHASVGGAKRSSRRPG